MKKTLLYFLLCSSVFSHISLAEGLPTILTSTAQGEIKTVADMLENGTNPNTRDKDGLTALIYAARKDNSKVVELLLQRAPF